MRVNSIYAVILRQIYLLSGNSVRLLPLFIWAAVDIILWGFTTKYLNQIGRSNLDFVPLLLGAILLWDFLVRSMHGLGVAFLEDAWSRNFLNIFASPLTLGEYLTGLVITSIITSLIGLSVMLALAIGVFSLSFAAYGLLIIPYLLILFLFGIALGILASALVLRYGPAAEWLMWPIPAVISPFAGVFYPIATLPQWMQTVSVALPPSYVFEGIRAVLTGKEVSAQMAFMGLGLAAVYILLACWFFKIIYKQAVRTGLIARYSAETVS